MRKNLPVTNIETKVRADQYLISRTDKKGKITYANPAFLEISGFTQDEIIGKPHNLIRHPDMPAEAFQDLWDTLQANKPWLGMVKNRRKDGGFYWLLANAAPICEHGEVTGYASVRIKPTEKQIQEAEAFYASVNAGQSTGYAIKHGQWVRRSWRRIADVAALPFANTIRSRMLRMAALSVAAVGSAAYFAAIGGFPAQYHWWITGGLAAASAGIVVLAWQITQSITQPLDGAAEIARQIAAGNLQVDIDSEATGEVGQLYFYLDLMRKSLMGIATDVHAGVEAATQVAQKLQANNTRLSARTEDQASSLQQTAASMEELTVTVKQNADNAHAANRLANDSMAIAQRGGNAVNEVVATMHGIHDSSKKIADIVSLIEGIAFQTNILALNAAVESARAGEAGRSFAVVAGEVRNLAQKSSVAAKEIKVLIDDSVSRIAAGSTQAASAGGTMQEIVDSVRRVTDIMGEISLASVEQSSGLEQINQAVAQMDIVTQQNAGLVQDLGLTVHDLTNEAQALNTAIGALSTGKYNSAVSQSTTRVFQEAQQNSHAMAISATRRKLEYARQ